MICLQDVVRLHRIHDESRDMESASQGATGEDVAPCTSRESLAHAMRLQVMEYLDRLTEIPGASEEDQHDESACMVPLQRTEFLQYGMHFVSRLRSCDGQVVRFAVY
jgi:hypothetical protein